MIGVICDRVASTTVTGKVYKVVVRPAILLGMEEVELEVIEFKNLQFSLGVARLDIIRNEYIKGTTQVKRFRDIVRGDITIVWAYVEDECKI